MIDYVKGLIVHKEADSIVVDVGGIGYRIYCSNPFTFPGTQEETIVYTHHHVREDVMLLFGFPTREEQAMFRRLIEVSGIGPRVAIGILSGGRPEAVAAAIQQENIAFLTKLPGIGKKTAQRMILDLKDKLADFAVSPTGASEAVPSDVRLHYESSNWMEAKEALAALGYSEAEIDRAVQAVRASSAESDSVDVLVKRALKELFNP